MALLDDNDVVQMRRRYREGKSTVKDLSVWKGVAPSTVLEALKGISFKHVTAEPAIPYEEMIKIRGGTLKRTEHPKTKQAIKTLIERGYTSAEIVGIVKKNGTTMRTSNIYRHIQTCQSKSGKVCGNQSVKA